METPDHLFPFSSASEQQTRAHGRRFAQFLSAGDVVALVGDLGAGKTQFVKGVASAFGIPEESVSSPTFTIAHVYRGARTDVQLELYHMDLYRLESEKELLQAGIEDYIDSGGISGGGICLIEWPERAASILPARTHFIRMTHTPDGKRRLEYAKAETH